MNSIVLLSRVAGGLLVAFLVLAVAQNPTRREVLVFDRPGNQWFEGALTQASISQDGNWALIGFPRDVHLYSLPTGRENKTALLGGLNSLIYAAFCGSGSPGLARLGTRGTENGWFLPELETPQFSAVPARSVLVCSPDGSGIGFFAVGAPDRGLFVGTRANYRDYATKGKVAAMAFSPNGEVLYYLAQEPNGESSLSGIHVRTGESRTIASHLDASRNGGPIAVSPDGKRAYLALASDGTPDNESRHKPNADRWLKIYQMDLSTGARYRFVDSPGQDNTGPTVVNTNLYWTRTLVRDSIVTVPVGGGDVKEVIAGGELPMWHPSGSKIGYYFGGWRLADWALNLDDAVVSVDADGNRTSGPSVIVSGYHEDFPPAWSPDGKWIAFHSHRSATPVPDYSSLGSTDDIYLRRADDLHAPEVRLTDFGWETGAAYWSPNGQKLMFVSYKRGGVPGIGKLWQVTVDTQKGAVLKTEMLPLPDDIRNVRSGMWSPDGKEIAIEDDQEAGKRTLWIVRADGSHPERVLDYEGTTYGGLDWTRDGKTIVYSGLAGDRLQLFSVSRSGGAPRQLTHASGNLLHPRISPNGRLIACTRLVQSKQVWRCPLP